MKKVEYTCDVCEGPLINRRALSWIEMVFGIGVFRHVIPYKKRLDVCNECWECLEDCKYWVLEQLEEE